MSRMRRAGLASAPRVAEGGDDRNVAEGALVGGQAPIQTSPSGLARRDRDAGRIDRDQPDVGLDTVKRQAAAVDHDSELGRDVLRPIGGAKRGIDFVGEPRGVDDLGGIEAGQGRNNAAPPTGRIVKAGCRQDLDQAGMGCRADAADLQVAAAGKIDQAIAAGSCRGRDRASLKSASGARAVAARGRAGRRPSPSADTRSGTSRAACRRPPISYWGLSAAI